MKKLKTDMPTKFGLEEVETLPKTVGQETNTVANEEEVTIFILHSMMMMKLLQKANYKTPCLNQTYTSKNHTYTNKG